MATAFKMIISPDVLFSRPTRKYLLLLSLPALLSCGASDSAPSFAAATEVVTDANNKSPDVIDSDLQSPVDIAETLNPALNPIAEASAESAESQNIGIEPVLDPEPEQPEQKDTISIDAANAIETKEVFHGVIYVGLSEITSGSNNLMLAANAARFPAPLTQSEVTALDDEHFEKSSFPIAWQTGDEACFIQGLNRESGYASFSQEATSLGDNIVLIAPESVIVHEETIVSQLPIPEGEITGSYFSAFSFNSIPASLSLRVPGISDIPVPVIADGLQVTAPIDPNSEETVVEPITADSIIEWIPTSDSADMVSIQGFQTLVIDDRPGWRRREGTISFLCKLHDDGYFEFSAKDRVKIRQFAAEIGQLVDDDELEFVAQYFSVSSSRSLEPYVDNGWIISTSNYQLADFSYSGSPYWNQ